MAVCVCVCVCWHISYGEDYFWRGLSTELPAGQLLQSEEPRRTNVRRWKAVSGGRASRRRSDCTSRRMCRVQLPNSIASATPVCAWQRVVHRERANNTSAFKRKICIDFLYECALVCCSSRRIWIGPNWGEICDVWQNILHLILISDTSTFIVIKIG